jgi:hypothetical protein
MPFMPLHMCASTRRFNQEPAAMGHRPDHVKPPAYLTPNTPVPEPEPMQRPEEDPLGRDPVRFGDWERKGIAVDF